MQEIQHATDTPRAIITPTANTLIITEIPPSAVKEIPDPAEFIRDYFTAINQRNYNNCWSRLSPHFIDSMSKKVGHNYTFSKDYASFYDTVDHMDVIDPRTDRRDAQSATVLVTLRWNMVNGAAATYNHRFHLVKDPNGDSWMIDSVETLQ